MATGDMKARLLLDSKDFDKNIKKSKKNAKDLGQETAQAGKTTALSMDKMKAMGAQVAVAVAAITAAWKVVDKTMNSVGKTQIEFKAKQEGMKAAVDSFFVSLNTGRWDNFLSQMRETATAAVTAAKGLEVLRNVQPTADLESKKYEYQKSRYEKIIKDPKSTEADITAATKELELLIADYEDYWADFAQDQSDAASLLLDAAFTKYQGLIPLTAPQTSALTASGRLLLGASSPVNKMEAPIRKEEVIEALVSLLQDRSALKKAIERNPMAYPSVLPREYRVNYAAEEMARSMTFEERETWVSLYSAAMDAGKKMEDETRAMEELIVGVEAARETERQEAEKLAEKQKEAAEKAAEAAKEWGHTTATFGVGTPVGWSFANNLTPYQKAGKGMREYYDVSHKATTGGEIKRWLSMDESSMTAAEKERRKQLMPQGFTTKIPMLDRNPAQGALEFYMSEYLKPFEEDAKRLEDINGVVGMLSGSFSQLGSSIGGAAGNMLTFVGGALDAAQAIIPLIAQIMAEQAAHKANASAALSDAAAKTVSAYAGIPFAGIALGVAGVAAIIGAMQSIPKFAEGGIVNRATLGVFGEAGPEAVMPLDKLDQYIQPRELRVTGNIKASGKELVVVLDNYNRVRNG